jgi:hypothetical protein
MSAQDEQARKNAKGHLIYTVFGLIAMVVINEISRQALTSVASKWNKK